MEKAYLISPSKKCGKKRVKIASQRAKKIGFLTHYTDLIFEEYLNYYAGTPKSRAEQINLAFEDKNSKVIFSVCGGRGGVHLLNKLDYKLIKKSKKTIVGSSDITILLNSIYKKTKINCIHGPNLGKNSQMSDESLEYLKKVLNKEGYRRYVREKNIFKKGFAKAKIIGGNLTLLERSLGTPYEIDTKNTIIFLEDVNEPESRIYDVLWQLELAGKFKYIKGVILGDFTNCGKNVYKYLKTFFKKFNIPILLNQPFGHEEPNISVPIGATCIIDTSEKYWEIIQK